MNSSKKKKKRVLVEFVVVVYVDGWKNSKKKIRWFICVGCVVVTECVCVYVIRVWHKKKK